MKNMKIDNLIFGRNAVKEALKSDRVTQIYLLDNFNDESVLSLIKQKRINVITVSRKELDNLSNNGVHQGIASKIKPYVYCDLNSLLSKCKKSEKKPLIIILDGINDPQNFGAIIRSADVFGVNGVIISKHNQVPLNSTVAKTSAGAINYVPVTLVNNLNQTIDILKKEGFWIVSTDGSGKDIYSSINYDFPTALVIGSEGKGVSSLVLKNSDFVVKIPQFGHVNSLNASVACGILLAKIRS